jgi:5-methylcytosine-specific restriction endonuclease McrA
LGLSEDVAGYFVRVARKSEQIPELKKAIAKGEISVTKARTIVSVLNSENQTDWLEKAKSLSKDKLERAVAESLPPGKKPERARAFGPDSYRVEFDLPAQLMEQFRRAQDLVSQSAGRPANLVETQTELLKLFLFHKDPLLKAARAAGRKSVESDQSRGRSASSLENSRNSIRSRKNGPSGGRRREFRKSRPKAIQHAVNLRDQGKCQARMPNGQTCGQRRFVEQHHIVPVARGGRDTLENLIMLCSAHHRMWHAREY